MGSLSYSEACIARPRALVASRSIRPLRTMAGPAVTVSSTHCRLGRGVHRLAVVRRRDEDAALEIVLQTLSGFLQLIPSIAVYRIYMLVRQDA